MKRSSEYLQQRIEACRQLFFQYEGREHSRIEREMRAMGFTDFNRRCLYPRGINSGWIEKFRWDIDLQRRAAETQSRSVRAEPPALTGGPGLDLEDTSTPPAHAGGSASSVGSPREGAGIVENLDPLPEGDGNVSTGSGAGSPDGHPGWGAGSDRGFSPSLSTVHRPLSTDISDFHSWLKKVSPPMFDWDAPHLRYIIEKLQLVTEGKIKKLMIFMPPRHGKSELVTTRYTAWRLKKTRRSRSSSQAITNTSQTASREISATRLPNTSLLRKSRESSESRMSSESKPLIGTENTLPTLKTQ